MKERIYGIDCDVTQEKFPDGKHSVYRFTVPGWPECKATGKRAAKRVIHGRLDPAVRNTLGIKWFTHDGRGCGHDAGEIGGDF